MTNVLKNFYLIKCKFSVEDQVKDFVQKVPLKTINQFSGQVFNLLKKLLTTIQSIETNNIAHWGLQILINITCISANTSIYLGSKQQFFETMQKLFEISPNDTAWLLNHVYLDGPVNLSQIIQSQIFSKFACALNSGLTVQVAIDTA